MFWCIVARQNSFDDAPLGKIHKNHTTVVVDVICVNFFPKCGNLEHFIV